MISMRMRRHTIENNDIGFRYCRVTCVALSGRREKYIDNYKQPHAISHHGAKYKSPVPRCINWHMMDDVIGFRYYRHMASGDRLARLDCAYFASGSKYFGTLSAFQQMTKHRLFHVLIVSLCDFQIYFADYLWNRQILNYASDYRSSACRPRVPIYQHSKTFYFTMGRYD